MQIKSSFDQSWWENFNQITNDFSSPQVFKNVLTEDDISNLLLHVKEVLTESIKYKVARGFRIYVDGEVDSVNLEYLHNNPLLEGELLDDWVIRVFGTKKFGAILNSVQNYSTDLRANLGSKFIPLIEKYGVPPHGLEVTLFLGNYGFTPLGFHKDPVGHKVTHLHLGPGPKEMYLIDSDKYQNELKHITEGKGNCQKYNELIPYSDKHEFKAGDVFFMPIDTYHVGNSPEFSVGLTIWHIEPSKLELSNRLSSELGKKIFDSQLLNNEIVSKGVNENPRNFDLSAKVDEITLYDEEYSNLNLEQAMNQLVVEHCLKMASNCYFYGFHPDLQVYPGAPDDLSLEDEVSGRWPFKIILETLSTGNSYFFIQGARLSMPESKNLDSIKDKINSYKPFKIRNLFEEMSEEWDKDLILYVAKIIFAKGGLIRDE